MSDRTPATQRFEVVGLPGIPEVTAGTDLAALIADAAESADTHFVDGDIVVVTSKIVSKAEGRTIRGTDREAAIDAEAVRTVAEWTTPRGRTRVVETRHGLVLAAAGVDASNVEPGTVVLLPDDPDTSARRLRAGLHERLGVRVGVVVTDTAGRVWRNGVVDLAVGAAGVTVVDDLRGQVDPYGNDLGVTVIAVADELASATELVRTKLSGVPVAVVRGLAHLVLAEDGPGARALVRPAAEDRFRLGTPEAMRAAVFERRDVRAFDTRPVPDEVRDRALAAAAAAAFPHDTLGDDEQRWTLDVADDPTRKTVLGRLAQAPGLDGVAAAPLVVAPRLLHDPTPADWLALGAAVENLLVALAADGIGSLWVTDPAADPVSNERSAGVIVAGYPAAAHQTPASE